MKIEGFKNYRHKDNPQEKVFHDTFLKHCSNDYESMDRIVFPPSNRISYTPSDRLSEREEKIVLSAIQWLGSPVGQGFLRDCGFVKKEE